MLRLDDAKPAATLLWSGPGEQDPRHDARDAEYAQLGHQHAGDRRRLSAGSTTTDNSAASKPRRASSSGRQRPPQGARDVGTAFFMRHGDRYFINNDQWRAGRGQTVAEGLRGNQPRDLDRADASIARRRQMPNVLWSHAAYANRHIIVRNDNEIVRFSLASQP
jgi:hypothetical protein